MKIKGIKKAVSEIKRNAHMHYIVYLDRSTGKVWADFYPDQNSWTQYRDTAITTLRGYYPDYMGNKVSMTQRITDAASIAIADFQEV